MASLGNNGNVKTVQKSLINYGKGAQNIAKISAHYSFFIPFIIVFEMSAGYRRNSFISNNTAVSDKSDKVINEEDFWDCGEAGCCGRE